MSLSHAHHTSAEYFWNLSYHLVLQQSHASSMIFEMCTLHCASVMSSLKRSRSSESTRSRPRKHGRSIPDIIDISTKEMISSACSRSARNPFIMSVLNWLKNLLRCPPSISTYSYVSLKAIDSKFMFFPGLFENMNPKSTWIMCPLESSKIFPLCLSLIYKM